MSRDGKPLELPGLYWDETRRRYFPLSSRPKRNHELIDVKNDEGRGSTVLQRAFKRSPSMTSASHLKVIRSGNSSFAERTRLVHELAGRALSFSHTELDPPVRPLSWHSSKITAFHTTTLDGTFNVLAGDSSGVLHCSRVEPRPISRPDHSSELQSDAFNNNARVFTSYYLGSGAPVDHIALSGSTAVYVVSNGMFDLASYIISVEYDTSVIISAISSTCNNCQLCIRDLKAPDDSGIFFVSLPSPFSTALHRTGMSRRVVFVKDISSVASAKSYTTLRTKSDVLSIFQRPNTLFAGCRSGEVRLFDVRSLEGGSAGVELLGGRFAGATQPSHFRSVTTWREEKVRKAHAAVTHLREVRTWEMLVCTSAGDLEMFDLRFCTGNRTQPTMAFTGHVNSYLLDLGIAIDPSSSFLFAAGQDRRVRGWSLRTGEPLGGFTARSGAGMETDTSASALLGGAQLSTPARSLEVSENPLRLWAAQDEEIRVWRLVALCSVVDVAFAVNPLVDVGYTKYLGTALPNGITHWLGMRYAAPPLDDLRFRAPADPPTNSTIQVADTHGRLCFATARAFPSADESEDCLFLDVFAPTSATTDSRLPVFFFIQGGGLNSDANTNYNASGLIAAADMDLVVVTFNYRVGPYGFLASEEVQRNGSINAGLLDQRKALQWVQEHISQFGGDPNHVALSGDSGGAQSITLHLTASNGTPTNLFHAVIAESQSFPNILTVQQSQFQYDALIERVGCTNETDTLACLRSTDIRFLQGNNTVVPYTGRKKAPNFLYGAVIDGDFLSGLPYNLFAQGKFVQVPSVFGDDTNEGTIFTPTDLNTTSHMDNFLADNFPNLTSSMLDTINTLYPKSSQFAHHGEFYFSAATAYGEMSPLPNWNYHYNVTDKIDLGNGLGVQHTVELNAIWGPNNTNGNAPKSYFTTNAAIIPVMQGYWTSFIRSFDPNKYRAPGSPVWEPFGTNLQRILFETNATRMETVPEDQVQRCNYLTSIALDLQQ
ncbi:hypothetical protein EW145_g5916 [Phellinidium pouzarii]|uniref:Carboxylesterase type B domain-containing protein n=1 Tax=Phellinidium pouzarii TaxID=167371 RepID=A0A4V3XBZ7_9AGAM|nr:hypothetical protein EW145_g5916 [Phellinidium pouzarii]